MSRRLHRAPFALASDGTVLVNVAEFDGVNDLAAALRRAGTEGGAVFVGVPAKPDEMADAVRHLGHGFREAAHVVIVGPRQRRSRRT